MNLEFEDVKYFNCHSFMKYVKHVYGKDIDIIREHAQYSGQDTFVKIDVTLDEPAEGWWPADEDLLEDPNKAFQLWLDGDDSVNANENLILWDMCRKGIISPGKYVTNIYW